MHGNLTAIEECLAGTWVLGPIMLLYSYNERKRLLRRYSSSQGRAEYCYLQSQRHLSSEKGPLIKFRRQLPYTKN